MRNNIRPLALKAAVLIFFIMGFIGTFKGYRPDVCCGRAFAGGFVTFAIVTVVGKIIVGILERRLEEIKMDKISELQQQIHENKQKEEQTII